MTDKRIAEAIRAEPTTARPQARAIRVFMGYLGIIEKPAEDRSFLQAGLFQPNLAPFLKTQKLSGRKVKTLGMNPRGN